MKNIILLLLLPVLSWAQCLSNFSEETAEDLQLKVNSQNNVNSLKQVRVNIHFMLRTDGTGNFTETHDNLGNNYSGYDFSRDLIQRVNYDLSYNIPMNLIPGNNTPVISKNYRFVIDAVFFHRNDNWFLYDSLTPKLYSNTGPAFQNVVQIHLLLTKCTNSHSKMEHLFLTLHLVVGYLPQLFHQTIFPGVLII